MNGKKARALRKTASDRTTYRALKRATKADQGQHPTPLVARMRKPKRPIRATWPATPNQMMQQRPMIVLHPARQLGAGKSGERKQEFRAACNALPKHECDAAVLRGYL